LLLVRTVLVARENGTCCSRERYLFFVRTVLIARENGRVIQDAYDSCPDPRGGLYLVVLGAIH